MPFLLMRMPSSEPHAVKNEYNTNPYDIHKPVPPPPPPPPRPNTFKQYPKPAPFREDSLITFHIINYFTIFCVKFEKIELIEAISQKPTSSVVGIAALRHHPVHVRRWQTARATPQAAGGEVPGAVPNLEARPVPAEPIQEVAAQVQQSRPSPISYSRVVRKRINL